MRASPVFTGLVEYHSSIQRKNAFSGALYLLSVPLAHGSVYASFFIFALIPAMYFLPETKLVADKERSGLLVPLRRYRSLLVGE